MKKIVLTYGLISGAVAAILMYLMALSIHNSTNFENGEIYGYAGILLSMLFVFLGVRAYRENVGEGRIQFGKAFQIGLLITLISCTCYVITWLLVYYNLMPDFMEKYMDHVVAKMKESGATEEMIRQKSIELEKYKGWYSNPWSIAALTFLEPFPIGLLVTLITAIVLRKK